MDKTSMKPVQADPELLDIATGLRQLACRMDSWFDHAGKRFLLEEYDLVDEIPEYFCDLQDAILSLLALKISCDLYDLS